MNVKKDSARPDKAGDATADTIERRRIGRVVRDDRDSAVVEWIDAPSDYQRVHLSIEGESTLPGRGPKRAGNGYNPYETISPTKNTAAPDKRPAKRDLRKLSAWIKQMREIEARKQRGDDDED